MGRLRTVSTAPPDKEEGASASDGKLIQVVSRAFDILRCFDSYDARLGNLEIAERCKLPRSTVSRLTQTLMSLGQLVCSPQDQKYRLGPSAIAMGAAMLHGAQFRNLARARLQDIAELIPGTFGILVPDQFDMVFLEYARTYNSVGLNSTVGTRVAMARSAAGLAYAASLDEAACESLLRDMAHAHPDDAHELRARIPESRVFLRQHGYVTLYGRWNPHITGCSVPLWSDRHRTFFVVTLGVLAAMYDEQRLHEELAPQVLKVAAEISRLSNSVGDELLIPTKIVQVQPDPAREMNESKGETRVELAAGAGRADAARSVRAGHGRRGKGQTPA